MAPQRVHELPNVFREGHGRRSGDEVRRRRRAVGTAEHLPQLTTDVLRIGFHRDQRLRLLDHVPEGGDAVLS